VGCLLEGVLRGGGGDRGELDVAVVRAAAGAAGTAGPAARSQRNERRQGGREAQGPGAPGMSRGAPWWAARQPLSSVLHAFFSPMLSSGRVLLHDPTRLIHCPSDPNPAPARRRRTTLSRPTAPRITAPVANWLQLIGTSK